MHECSFCDACSGLALQIPRTVPGGSLSGLDADRSNPLAASRSSGGPVQQHSHGKSALAYATKLAVDLDGPPSRGETSALRRGSLR
jgi:hypothetical protein